jgi:S-DNA-T family DNA segregation ATPase FtsK/SpoIIIE
MNVTQLKYAVLDDAYRRALLNGENPATPFASGRAGSVPVQGVRFHAIARRFLEWLVEDTNANRLDGADVLWEEMHDRFAASDLASLARKNKAASALHLVACLRSFCARIVTLRERGTDANPGARLSWSDVFLMQEMRLPPTDVGDCGLLVSGQIDLVRTDQKHGVVVVDYKLSRGATARHDLVQLAIYAQMLSRLKPGLKFTGILEYYEPELTVTELTPVQLGGLFDDVVLPVLHQLSSVTPRGNRVADSAASEGDSSPVVAMKQADPFAEQLVDAFAEFKLGIEVLDSINAPQLHRYRIKPNAGVKVTSLANRADDVQVRLGLPLPPIINPSRGCVTVDVLKDDPDTVYWRDVISSQSERQRSSPVAFAVGVGLDGEPLWCDLADPNCCHALVAGVSGSGKSEFLKSVIASLVRQNGYGDVAISLIDPKVVTFVEMSGNGMLSEPVISDLETAIECLSLAVAEMDKRYARFAQVGVSSLKDWLDCGHSEMNYRVIVFDEFADLVLSGGEVKKEFETLVARISSKGRAAGIHLLLATQRPDRNIVTGVIKANLPLKVCLRVTNAVNSKIVLDEVGAENLRGRGDLLVDRGKGIERAQSLYLEPGELKKLAA